jgi:ribose 5-phosphate isomerase
MKTNDKNKPEQGKEQNKNVTKNTTTSSQENDAVEEDGTPVLDEEDLEENDLDIDEADDIEWEPPKEK